MYISIAEKETIEMLKNLSETAHYLYGKSSFWGQFSKLKKKKKKKPNINVLVIIVIKTSELYMRDWTIINNYKKLTMLLPQSI